MTPQVWSPFQSTRREIDGRTFLPVDAPSGPGQLGDLIVTRGGQARMQINRIYNQFDKESLRARRRRRIPLCVSVEVLDHDDRRAPHVIAGTHTAEPVKGSEWWRRSVSPTAFFDEAGPCRSARIRRAIPVTGDRDRRERYVAEVCGFPGEQGYRLTAGTCGKRRCCQARFAGELEVGKNRELRP